MAKVFLVHWHELEAKQHARDLSAEDHDVHCHWSTEIVARWPEGYLPQAVVISLDRLPSHGRAYAGWLGQEKQRREIPLVFAGGAPDKVAATKSQFPRARYCAFTDLPNTLSTVIEGKEPPSDDVKRRSAAAKARR